MGSRREACAFKDPGGGGGGAGKWTPRRRRHRLGLWGGAGQTPLRAADLSGRLRGPSPGGRGRGQGRRSKPGLGELLPRVRPRRLKFVDLEGVAGAGARVLIIPIRSAAALYSLHSCHLRYSLINNKIAAFRERPLDAGPRAESFTSTVPWTLPLKTLSPFYRAGRRGSERRCDLPEVNRPVSSSGIKALGPGEAGRAVLPPAPRRAAGAERRAGRKARGCAAEDGHLKWPLRVQGRFPGEGGFEQPRRWSLSTAAEALGERSGSPRG